MDSRKTLIEAEVDRLFAEMNAKRGEYCVNPVTGGTFIWGDDPIALQKRQAVHALVAREWFAAYGPADAPTLPLTDRDIQDYREARGLTGGVGFYARSLSFRQWDIRNHPIFDEFVRGLLAINTDMWGLEKDENLKKVFTPRPLAGMTPGCYWAPPEEYEELMASYKRARKAA
jgi:hypothetical protein